MGSSSKKYRDRSRDRDRDRDEYSDEDDDYSSSRRDRDRKDRSSRRKDKDEYDDYDDRYSTSSKKEKKKKDRKKYDDEDRSSSYNSPRASQVQPPMNMGYSNQGYQQQQQPQGYPSSASQGSWNAPPPPLQQQPQAQYGSAPQSWQNDPRYAPPPRDPYERSNSSYPAPPESSYGQQSSYGGWDNSSQALPPPPRDPRFDQVPSRQNYNQSIPPSQSYPGAPPMQQQDYDRMRPQYDRAPASAPAAASYQREFSQPPAQSPSFNSAPPFAGPPPPIPPPPIPQPSPLSQPSITAADQWQAYYARQAQAQTQTSSWPPVAPPSTTLQPPPPQQTVSSTPSPGLDNGAQGHWRAGENGQWTWVVVAPEPPPPVQQLPPTPPIYSTPPPPPPPPSMPPPSYPPQIGSLPSSYPIFSPPPVPSASAPPSTMNPYVQSILSAQQQQQSQMYQAQIPQRPLLPSQTSSYMSGQPQQPIYQVVQPVELVQPVQVAPPRPRPSAPSVPAESEYSDESRGRRRYDDEDEDSDYRSRRGRSNSRRRRRRSRSRSKSTKRSPSRNRGDRNYVEYEEKHYIKSGDPPPPPAPSRNSGRKYSVVEPEEVVRYVDDDRKTRRNDSTPTPAPHLVRRIEVYENDDRPSSSRGGGAGDTRKVYEMRSLGKGQSARRESMSSEAERQRQLAAQIAQEEAAILQQRFGSKSKDSRRVETKSDESWEQVEVPPAQTRRARRNSVADSFRQNHYVEESMDQRARAPVPPSMPPKPSIDNAKASRIAAWSMAVPLTSDMDTLSLDEADSAAISRPRSAMKGGRAQAAPAYSNPLPAVDDLDSVVEPFDPFAPVTTAQSASALYPSWQQSARR